MIQGNPYILDPPKSNLINVVVASFRYKPCKKEDVPKPYINFLKVREVNDWWRWVNETVLENVRVQNWYNGKPPYGLRGPL